MSLTGFLSALWTALGRAFLFASKTAAVQAGILVLIVFKVFIPLLSGILLMLINFLYFLIVTALYQFDVGGRPLGDYVHEWVSQGLSFIACFVDLRTVLDVFVACAVMLLALRVLVTCTRILLVMLRDWSADFLCPL